MFTEKVVDNWHYVSKKARFQNYVNEYSPGQNIALYFFATTSLSSLDHLQRFVSLSKSTNTFTAFITQEYSNIQYPQILYQENIIQDNYTFSKLLSQPVLPQVLIFASYGLKIFEGHPASFELRGFISRQPKEFKDSQINQLLTQLVQSNQKQQQIVFQTQKKSRAISAYFAPKKQVTLDLSQYLKQNKKEIRKPTQHKSKSVQQYKPPQTYDTSASLHKDDLMPISSKNLIFKNSVKNLITGESLSLTPKQNNSISNRSKSQSFTRSNLIQFNQTPQHTDQQINEKFIRNQGPPPGRPKFRRPGPAFGDDLQNLLNCVTPIRNVVKKYEMYDKRHIGRSKSNVVDLRKVSLK